MELTICESELDRHPRREVEAHVFIRLDVDQRHETDDSIWEQPFLVASINQAKSKKNYARVTGREYDMVIVDEVHHLKNRNTLNLKLINDLQKRFLLPLTATPVETTSWSCLTLSRCSNWAS
jgi:superfamily II DNA or RNA helicase